MVDNAPLPSLQPFQGGLSPTAAPSSAAPLTSLLDLGVLDALPQKDVQDDSHRPKKRTPRRIGYARAQHDDGTRKLFLSIRPASPVLHRHRPPHAPVCLHHRPQRPLPGRRQLRRIIRPPTRRRAPGRPARCPAGAHRCPAGGAAGPCGSGRGARTSRPRPGGRPCRPRC